MREAAVQDQPKGGKKKKQKGDKHQVDKEADKSEFVPWWKARKNKNKKQQTKPGPNKVKGKGKGRKGKA